MPDDRFDAYRRSVDWMQTYIFPGSLIPSLGAIGAGLVGTGLTLDLGRRHRARLRADAGGLAGPLRRRAADRCVALGFDDRVRPRVAPVPGVLARPRSPSARSPITSWS
jgi:hypothetical protein